MVSAWRRTFSTSKALPENREPTPIATLPHQQQYCHYDNTTQTQSPNLSSNFTFFSTPSIPHSESRPLRCRTSAPNSPLTNQCNNARTPSPKRSSPMSFHSPNSPSAFSLLKATLRLSKNLCGICTKSVKAGEGKAIFTAECSHTFHFPCIAAHVKKRQMLACPVCSTHWKELQTAGEDQPRDPKTTKPFKLHTYNDDEPLMSPTSVSRFNPIPESNENEEADDDDEEQSQEPTRCNVSSFFKTTNLDAYFSPEAAIVASNRSFENYVAVLKVKARNASPNRPPVDLVTVLDVGGTVSGEDLRMLKRSMQFVISSLGSADRLSIVAFAGGSKRLFPLRRMTGRGQTAARRIIDALSAIQLRRDGTPARNDALKKAAKVLEDRRHRNTVAKILLLTNINDDPQLSSTQFPVHSLSYVHEGACGHAQRESEFTKRVESMLSVVAHDLTLELKPASRSASAEIAGVYSLSNPSAAALSAASVALGDLYAAEERELLVEIKVPAGTALRGSHRHFVSVRSSHRDPFAQELVHSKEHEMVVPRPHTVRSADPLIERLRRIHVSARAVAESRRLVARNDVSGALHLLESARASVLQTGFGVGNVCLRWLEAEQAELSHKLRTNRCLEEKAEPLTPMSAWRVAEKLAKVAIMRKSLNRVSDLHGFEDARF